MKKQRSASPSHAIPRSAPVSRTFAMITSRFSASSGLGSWSGKLPSGVQYSSISSGPSRSSSGPTIGPAIPLPPSSTIVSGRDIEPTTSGSMKRSAAAWNAP